MAGGTLVAMQMRFGPDEDGAFSVRREELREEFARLFATAGELVPGGVQTDAELAQVLGRLQGLPPDAVGEVLSRVRLPGAEERLAAVRSSSAMRMLHWLGGFCVAPGRAVTGNLRLADARLLVQALDTGDDLELGGSRSLRSAADLPALSGVVDLAVAAGVVRLQRGRLVAVARFAGLDEVAAHERGAGGGTGGVHRVGQLVLPEPGRGARVRGRVGAGAAGGAVDAGAAGVAADELTELVAGLVAARFPGMWIFTQGMVPGLVERIVGGLAALAVVEFEDSTEVCPECAVAHQWVRLTAAGVAPAVELVGAAGIEVRLFPDPVTADAAAIAGLLGEVEAPEWVADAGAWFAAQPDPAPAADALVAEFTTAERDSLIVVGGLEGLDEVLAEFAVPAVRAQQGGPHDGLVLHWLLARSAVDPGTVDPARFVGGLVDVLAAGLDGGGPEEVVSWFANIDQGEQQQMLAQIWRLDHPRLPEVLDAIGHGYPVKTVAKAARRALMQHRSRLGRVGRESMIGRRPAAPACDEDRGRPHQPGTATICGCFCEPSVCSLAEVEATVTRLFPDEPLRKEVDSHSANEPNNVTIADQHCDQYFWSG